MIDFRSARSYNERLIRSNLLRNPHVALLVSEPKIIKVVEAIKPKNHIDENRDGMLIHSLNKKKARIMRSVVKRRVMVTSDSQSSISRKETLPRYKIIPICRTEASPGKGKVSPSLTTTMMSNREVSMLKTTNDLASGRTGYELKST